RAASRKPSPSVACSSTFLLRHREAAGFHVSVAADQGSVELEDQVVPDNQTKALVIEAAGRSVGRFLKRLHLCFQSLVLLIGQMNIHHGHCFSPSCSGVRSSLPRRWATPRSTGTALSGTPS